MRRARRRDERLAQLRHQQVGDHAGEPGAGAEQQHVGRFHRIERLRAGPRSVRAQPDPLHPARGGRDRHLAPDERAVAGPEAGDLGLDVERVTTHRQHPAAQPEQRGDLVERGDRVAEHLHQAGEQQVADRVPGERAGAAEAVLHELAPATSRVVVGGERGEGHPQVAGWEHAELAAQPAGRPAVVGDRDDGGDVVGEPPQGGQGGVQPVAAAERDRRSHARPRSLRVHSRPRSLRVHSRPRSRCVTFTVTPSEPASLRAISSLMATLRCLPPVQPTATVR